MIFYKNGFYIQGLHIDIPANAIEITRELHHSLMEGQSQGKAIVADKSGYPILTEQAPTPYHYWDGEKWVISPEKLTALFEQNKQNLITKIATKTDAIKAELLVGYPQAEIDSFYRQEAEAKAYKANLQANTPMLRQIAENRGIEFEELVEKVLEKAQQFANVIGAVIGSRQGFEDRILAAKSQEELEQIEKEVNAWQLSI